MLSRQLPEDIVSFLMKSCAESTWKNYSCYIRQWNAFCNEINVDPVCPNLSNVLRFLYNLYEKNVGYSVINTARSSLSIFVNKIDGYEIGKHPLINRFVKAVFRSRPPKARYDSVWDASKVLKVFKEWPENSDLNLKQLSMKLVSLLALCTGQRCQTLAMIKLEDVVKNLHVEIRVSSLVKTSAPGRCQPCLVLPKFLTCPLICPVAVLETFLERTNSLRNHSNLLISINRPHGPVTAQTVSRWLKDTLQVSGISVTDFSGYSFRHASTSKASSTGVSVDVIYSRAGWSAESEMFARHYKRPIDQRHTYATAVLS